MNYVGNIIKKYRCMLKMSRKTLSENICSEKYVYLIEKGERTPSAYMVGMLGDRMGVDLFDYYQYLDCINPIAVREYIKRFNMYSRKSDFVALKKETDTAVNLPDFHRKPWIYEIEINRLSYMIFIQHKYYEAMRNLNDVISNIELKYSMDIRVAKIYILLSICCMLTGSLPNAKKAVSSAYKIVCNKNKIDKYEQIIITVRISSISMHYLSGEFDDVIREGSELFHYQHEINSYERICYTYFYLSFANYKKGSYDEAIEWFKKGIYSVLIDNRPMDVYYMSTQDVFDAMMNDRRINRGVIREFREKYNIG
ncbi:MAG: helix-turn-helix transcriptional regulator [Clostridiales bacterium]|nr:helix-turn-helix transcriptional regulator [Clostridiales bacterium]HBM81762.1 hypothetical protein [Clostridiaceae bacterium]